MKISAGIICFKHEGELKIFLAHSTGHQNIWSFPKGECDPDEGLFACAIREFEEETSLPVPSKLEEYYIYLGVIKQNQGKLVHAFAIEADINPKHCKSNWCEFPIGTGKMIPELDDYKWVSFKEAMEIINPKQIPLLVELEKYLYFTQFN